MATTTEYPWDGAVQLSLQSSSWNVVNDTIIVVNDIYDINLYGVLSVSMDDVEIGWW